MKKAIIITLLFFSLLFTMGALRGRYGPAFWRAVPGGIEYTGGDVTISNGILDSSGGVGNLIPDVNNTYDLGSTAKRWKDLYMMGGSIYLGSLTIEDTNGCLAANEFHAHGGAGVSGYYKLAHGTTPSAHKEAGHSILWADGNDVAYLEKADGTDCQIIKDDGSGNVGVGIDEPNSALHIKANVPGTQVGSHPAGQLIIQNPADSVLSNAVITGYESDAAGNPDQQLWYLGNSSSGNSDVLLLNRRASSLHLGTNDLIRMTVDAGGDIYTVAWTDYGGTSTVVGFSGTPTVNIWYKKIGNLVYVNFYISGTSNDTPFTFTLPYTNVNDTNSRVYTAIRFKDNNTQSTIPGQIYLAPNTNIAVLYTDWAAQVWTPANTKEAMGQFWFEAQ